MIKVGVFGHNGKMGSEVVRAVEAAEDMVLHGVADLGDDREGIAGASVIVDFTHPDAVLGNIEWCVERGIHLVVGTTGFSPKRLERVRQLCAAKPEVGVLIAANFSIGANLMMRFAELAAPHYPSVEIIELHHPNKADAPSGTATSTAQRVAAARAAAGLGPVPDATVHDELGARGAVIDGVHVHGVRLAGLVAHQEVLLGTSGESLTIRHDSFDRASFMPGVLAGVRFVGQRPGLTLGMSEVLGI
ncbi:4-hydroxy-tetrahydrodipicolinate reductase [Tessaracoccus sp. OH4464_COT-324]|uniref:4-hydroxy-tetrahydrodipicolinate reductase n=1 Tax=Tessaracoccus sp. OH4464_COT-324 TaxID=2491059 RepID=UPI0018F54D40|nr:4-hydroxy-tetrahydrodipicolinate reductase [Tessaracoccus sp. OH4464_COT-324]